MFPKGRKTKDSNKKHYYLNWGYSLLKVWKQKPVGGLTKLVVVVGRTVKYRDE